MREGKALYKKWYRLFGGRGRLQSAKVKVRLFGINYSVSRKQCEKRMERTADSRENVGQKKSCSPAHAGYQCRLSTDTVQLRGLEIETAFRTLAKYWHPSDGNYSVRHVFRLVSYAFWALYLPCRGFLDLSTIPAKKAVAIQSPSHVTRKLHTISAKLWHTSNIPSRPTAFHPATLLEDFYPVVYLKYASVFVK